MTAVALALAAGWAVSVAVLVRLIEQQSRAHARKEGLMLNQILHLSGNTWQEPPRERELVELFEEESLVDPDQVYA